MYRLAVKLRALFLNLILLFYVGFALLSLENCSKHDDSFSTAEQIARRKNEAVKLLLHEFNAQLFDCTIKTVFGKPVILDTTLMGISKKGADIFINAQINTSCIEKYFVKLKCSKEIFEQYKKTITNNVLLAARFTRMDNEKLAASVDSLDGFNQTVNLEETIIFTGECLAIKEIPLVANAN